MGKLKVSVVIGTRPEAIKLCPLVLAMQQRSDRFVPHVCVTGQHKEMVEQVLDVFGVTPDIDLKLMRPNQTLAGLTALAVQALDGVYRAQQPDWVLVQGDTTTVLSAALCAYYHKIRIGHVEAGLRTWNKYSPWPEEINRRAVAPMADLHFAPTEQAKASLRKENVPDAAIQVVGNSVIDALLWVRNKIDKTPPALAASLGPDLQDRRMILVTGHRRENFGKPFEAMCNAFLDIVNTHADVLLVYPVHLNPNVQEPVNRMLGAHPRIRLLPPQPYTSFVWLMNASWCVLTDSGGVQEEAPSLGKPVLVMRDTTERPEGVAAGNARLIGCDAQAIRDNVHELMESPTTYKAMSTAGNPYGDGNTSERILRCLTAATR